VRPLARITGADPLAEIKRMDLMLLGGGGILYDREVEPLAM